MSAHLSHPHVILGVLVCAWLAYTPAEIAAAPETAQWNAPAAVQDPKPEGQPAVRGESGGRPRGGCDADDFRVRPPAPGLTRNGRHPCRTLLHRHPNRMTSAKGQLKTYSYEIASYNLLPKAQGLLHRAEASPGFLKKVISSATRRATQRLTL